MSNVMSPRWKCSTISLIFAASALLSTHAQGQDATPAHGVVDDWSTHHLVFSNPGSESDAIKTGRYGEWLRTVNDPRYVMQQQRRASAALQPSLVAPLDADTNVLGRTRFPEQGPRFGAPGGDIGGLRLNSSIHKDWSMDDGGTPASLTITVGTVSGTTVTSGSTVTVDGHEFTTAAPASASQMGTFNGDPATGQTIIIGGTETLTASDSTAASGTITIAATGLCFANGAGVSVNGTPITTNAAGGTGTFTINSTTGNGGLSGESVTIGGVTYNFVAALPAGSTPANAVLVASSGSGTTNSHNTSRNLAVAINNSGTCGDEDGGSACTKNISASNPEVTSSNTAGTATQTMTSICANNAAFTTGFTGSADVTVNDPGAGTVGTTSAAGATIALGTSAGTDSNTTIANAISTVINGNATLDGSFTSSVSSGIVTVTAQNWGSAGNSDTLALTGTPNPTGVTLSGATLAGGTDGLNTGNNFAVVNNSAGNASNLELAINRGTTNPGVTASVSGATVTVTANTAGTGANAITTTASGVTGFSWGGATLAGGTNGPGDTATTFNYWNGTGYDSASQLATDLASAFTADTALTPSVTATASTDTVVLDSTAIGASGDSLTASETGFSALTIPNGGDFSGGAGGVAANMFPAKYSFSTTTASCSDYIVYPTGVAGSSSSATIIAYNNIYDSPNGTTSACNGTKMAPPVYWAFYTPPNGGSDSAESTLSPVLSLDGSQVAFVETDSSASGSPAYLVVLRMAAETSSTLGAPVLPTYYASTSYHASCTASTAPCYTTLEFHGDTADTNSPPFYDYPEPQDTLADTLWVGDNSGDLHQFTGVFLGTPTETTSSWPVNVVSSDTAKTGQTTPAPLTGPVFDNASKYIFVTDGDGYLHSISTATTPVVETSSQMECGTYGFVDSPIVDSTYEDVYIFSGDGCNATPGQSYINRFTVASLEATGSGFGAVAAGFGNAATNDTSTVAYSGSFDNIFYNGASITTGNMYACVNGELFQVPMSKLGTTTGFNLTASYDTAVSTVSDTAGCSPVTEFYDGTNDWVYISVAANGNGTGCTGACLYNYKVATATSGTATAGQLEAGGTSGIVVDNNSTTQTGAKQIYYTTRGGQNCTGNGSTGSGFGICAIQASQSAP